MLCEICYQTRDDAKKFKYRIYDMSAGINKRGFCCEDCFKEFTSGREPHETRPIKYRKRDIYHVYSNRRYPFQIRVGSHSYKFHNLYEATTFVDDIMGTVEE